MLLGFPCCTMSPVPKGRRSRRAYRRAETVLDKRHVVLAAGAVPQMGAGPMHATLTSQSSPLLLEQGTVTISMPDGRTSTFKTDNAGSHPASKRRLPLSGISPAHCTDTPRFDFFSISPSASGRYADTVRHSAGHKDRPRGEPPACPSPISPTGSQSSSAGPAPVDCSAEIGERK